MEKFKRTLTLLNIPVLEINDLTELDDVLGEVENCEWITWDQFQVEGYYNEIGPSEALSKIAHHEVLIGVEESSILFVDSDIFQKFIKTKVHQLFLMVIKERDIVETIEIALYKISNGSGFYGKSIQILEPKDIPRNCIIIITKH
jgi:DNA integrity scanning protein DisA with diadenylate cyclase activity